MSRSLVRIGKEISLLLIMKMVVRIALIVRDVMGGRNWSIILVIIARSLVRVRLVQREEIVLSFILPMNRGK